MTIRPRRSALYMPASNAKAIEKAQALDCDVVILDLEDAVAPEVKAAARDAAVAAVQAGGFGRRELIVRANGLDTPWGAADLAALAACRPHGVLVPKINDAAAVAAHAEAAGGVPLWVMIETTSAVFRLEEIARAVAAAGGGGFVLGTNDLAKEMGARLTVARTPFLGMMAAAVAAARGAGLAILDGVHNVIDDEAGLAAQCDQGVEFGFDGKTLIHPRQIGPCNAAYTPDAAAVAWARTIIAAFAAPDNAGKGAMRVEGRMVERLHLAQAERDLAIADWAAG